MAYHWPEKTEFIPLDLDVENRTCGECSGKMHVCDHRHHPVYTLGGPVWILCRLMHCADPSCPGRHRTISPEMEMAVALPKWAIAWDVFAWIGLRRFARHWSVPQLRDELLDTYKIQLSADAIEDYVQRYQAMVAAWHQAPATLAADYRGIRSLVLSIDGLQPEKGHETLYVVRELRLKRVWFATPLLSSSAEEVQAVLVQAEEWAARLGLPVVGWVSDKQDAFVSGIQKVFPGVPHRFCRNHFVRDVAKPVLEADSQAKVRMRRKVRGLRAIERAVLEARRARERRPRPSAKRTEKGQAAKSHEEPEASVQEAEEITLDYCAGVRGILNDDQGGPLSPPGLRMADALADVRESIQQCLDEKKGGQTEKLLEQLGRCIDRGCAIVAPEQRTIRKQVRIVARIDATLEVENGPMQVRRAEFDAVQRELEAKTDEVSAYMAAKMKSFRPGLFVGAKRLNLSEDNLDLERFFRLPKSHERHIHGRAHAGVRIVEEGATLIPAVDAHRLHPEAFSAEELIPFAEAEIPEVQRQAIHRRRVMRQARSKKTRARFLRELERRYRDSS